jgi:hypothetical protein
MRVLHAAILLALINSGLVSQDKKPEKEAEGYDFFQEDALKTMENELDNYERSHEDTKAIKGMFIQRNFDDKDKDTAKKKTPPFYRNTLVRKKVKLHLSGGQVIQGEIPFNGDKITIISEKDGIKTTHEFPRGEITVLEFSKWKPYREGMEPYQNLDFKVKKYYFLPSFAKLVLASGAKIEGQIDPFEILAFTIQSDTGRSSFGAYFADTMVPTQDISELLKDKNKHKAQLESLEYKWLLANTTDMKYYENNIPKQTIKKVEFLAVVEPNGKNEAPKPAPTP